MAETPNLVHVEIFGQSYAVRAGADARYVEELASYVDHQMRDVSRAAGAVDSVRIAVLAALNIADERFQLRAQIDKGEATVRARAASLTQTLSAAIED